MRMVDADRLIGILNELDEDYRAAVMIDLINHMPTVEKEEDEMRACECVIGRLTKYEHNAAGELVDVVVREGEKYEGYFHQWVNQSGRWCAIMETKDGRIVMPDAVDVKFTDMQKHNNNMEYKTITDAVNQLESCGYTCKGGPLETNTAFMWLKKISGLEKRGLRVLIKWDS